MSYARLIRIHCASSFLGNFQATGTSGIDKKYVSTARRPRGSLKVHERDCHSKINIAANNVYRGILSTRISYAFNGISKGRQTSRTLVNSSPPSDSIIIPTPPASASKMKKKHASRRFDCEYCSIDHSTLTKCRIHIHLRFCRV